jgi:hypothetical protein
MRNAFIISVRKSARTRPLGRPRRRWKENIKMDLEEIESEAVDWFQLAQHKVRWWFLVNNS